MTKEQKTVKRFTERFLKIYYANHDRFFESLLYKMVYDDIKRNKYSRQAVYDCLRGYKTESAKKLIKEIKEVYR